MKEENLPLLCLSEGAVWLNSYQYIANRVQVFTKAVYTHFTVGEGMNPFLLNNYRATIGPLTSWQPV